MFFADALTFITNKCRLVMTCFFLIFASSKETTFFRIGTFKESTDKNKKSLRFANLKLLFSNFCIHSFSKLIG